MSNILKAKVNNNFDFDISSDDISSLDIVSVSNSNYHLLHDDKSFHCEINNSNFSKKTYQVSVNNTLYKVQISNDLDVLINDMGFSIGSKKAITSIIAPMPGLILEINIEVGQDIKENDTLLILEAMKMENSITSPIDGVIKAIHSKKGDAVDKGQLIIEFE
ncbi:acetyl-CoA carboxylase biotin carboxyl carrier protein subunit [Hyunsoonleella flava]|uniref:Acetyl-CoA carboxylase biotin carboxyl carrier protein subunit n=1 Tax=Hyunsoonleella flava TaxID=2527939 RepID=A0A4Q9FDZ3_9FLAO|nr:acetyl-CoA carboxylase biotin carboxyl carrier protein subunit [Hyunsoonleella flava]TBN03017.1 acetyl-CoA carboxylase biotin carboxyl carrier protein subunit [Hyunsoonleella flava]